MTMMKTASLAFCAGGFGGASSRGCGSFCAPGFAGWFPWAARLVWIQFQEMRRRDVTIFTNRKTGLRPPMKKWLLPTLKFANPGKPPFKKSKKRFPIRPCLYSLTEGSDNAPCAPTPRSEPLGVLECFRIHEDPSPRLQRRKSESPFPSSLGICTPGSRPFPGPTTTPHDEGERPTTTRHFQLRIKHNHQHSPKQMAAGSDHRIGGRFVADTARKGLGAVCLPVFC